MKWVCSVLPLAAITTAWVLPEKHVMEQIAIETHPHSYPNRLHDSGDTLWSGFDSQDAVVVVDNAVSSATKVIQAKVECHQSTSVFSAQEWLTKTEEDLDIDESITGQYKPQENPQNLHQGQDSLPTVYQLITSSEYTQKFAKLIDEHPDLVELLNGTASNYTVFVPTDASFPNHPDDGKEPPKELVHKVLSYHISPLPYDAYSIFFARTIGTLLTEESLGGYPQRLRVGFGLSGLRLNFKSRIITADIHASNGILHLIDSLNLPPPPLSTLLSSSPTLFSTFSLALLKTGLDTVLHDPHTKSPLTIFAPTNDAFAKLGPAVNAFLFSKVGESVLRALVEYHIVANRALYSDAYFTLDRPDDVVDEEELGGEREGAGPDFHADLPTLLRGQSLSVDVKRWGRLIDVRVNGFLSVQVVDGVAKDGVLHTMGEVLLPPKNPGREPRDGEGEVEEFLGRFEGLVKDL
ncbi:Fasciclin-domain-containing protein [Hyaloscypha variabilis F]|uniref:Fasciclin-domain-containing protein n=1 Tax=Hyaloscypha variabilis (strain UAMH 11265 / GT02V1 / F) TaxID=1149755 RepID=A0A2J6RZG8_HYAVF|nr:Fasciclin-domain-containing protein [Hyaloscypha variabilis F]